MNRFLPEAPEGVVASINGIEYPMKLRYLGPLPSGHQAWEACWPEGVEPPMMEDFRGMRVDKLPGHALIRIDIKDAE